MLLSTAIHYIIKGWHICVVNIATVDANRLRPREASLLEYLPVYHYLRSLFSFYWEVQLLKHQPVDCGLPEWRSRRRGRFGSVDLPLLACKFLRTFREEIWTQSSSYRLGRHPEPPNDIAARHPPSWLQLLRTSGLLVVKPQKSLKNRNWRDASDVPNLKDDDTIAVSDKAEV